MNTLLITLATTWSDVALAATSTIGVCFIFWVLFR